MNAVKTIKEPGKPQTSNPFFDSLKSILSTKQYWFLEDKDYSPIGVNIGLSQHLDSILFVNEVNIWWQYLTTRMHYDYLFHSIRKMPRKYASWAKKHKNEDVELIMEYYQISKSKAEDYLELLTEDNLEAIKKEVYQ